MADAQQKENHPKKAPNFTVFKILFIQYSLLNVKLKILATASPGAAPCPP
jgi:hypothetical protein